ncbi:hypothetical protein U1Q18_035843, partial [Sarracenia purpurea var. burkii]
TCTVALVLLQSEISAGIHSPDTQIKRLQLRSFQIHNLFSSPCSCLFTVPNACNSGQTDTLTLLFAGAFFTGFRLCCVEHSSTPDFVASSDQPRACHREIRRCLSSSTSGP